MINCRHRKGKLYILHKLLITYVPKLSGPPPPREGTGRPLGGGHELFI
jgi:hypothetical protein